MDMCDSLRALSAHALTLTAVSPNLTGAFEAGAEACAEAGAEDDIWLPTRQVACSFRSDDARGFRLIGCWAADIYISGYPVNRMWGCRHILY